MAEERAWQEFWAGGEGDEAVGGAQRHRLAELWASLFVKERGRISGSALIVDIAAGRGVALKAAIETLEDSSTFLALDYSPAAAASARRTLSQAVAAAADAARLPLSDGCAAAVISQFGIEYAGFPAFAEAARIIAPMGAFCSISHFRGGAIDAECAENERLIMQVADAALFLAARQALADSFRRRDHRDPQPGDAALERAFSAAMKDAATTVNAAYPSAAKATLERFLADLARLSARRLAFDAMDALGWLDGMEASLGAYLKRMRSMRAAALDHAAIDRIQSIFSESGLGDFRAGPLLFDAKRLPAAWVIEARRP